MVIPVRLNGKKIGKIRKFGQGKTYITYRKPEHRMRKFDSYGITEELLRQLRDEGVEYVLIYAETETGRKKKLNSKIGDWFNKGIEWVDDTHRSGDKQLHLPIDEMNRIY